MPRYKLTVEYDGSGYCGWQRQEHGPSVQQALEEAVLRFCQSETLVQCAGRTDAGVHATAQVAHFDAPREYRTDRVRDGLNFHLRPHPIAVLAAEEVDDDFHARFSAIGRSYLYRIVNRRAPAALEASRVWWVPVALDAEAMQAGANYLLGHHDFTTFRASECQAKSPLKTLGELTVTRVGEEIRIITAARSFLHHQVRNMVGTLRLVGEGKWQPEDVKRALEARDRGAGGPTCPPDGLYLTGVKYPVHTA
ncbi:MAG TPA: tRNA pseudouridine(38-40) synthase TruA [Magnetospirillum sp.]|jgi:tRNA pseudouridine38-40 synthase|nr:tRNA pseudouridine(38-40) synthase TruA [Magnetospirillum sp.]